LATTPNLALPYPALTDSPNVPRDIKALADNIDTKMQFLPVSSTSQIAAPFDGQIVYNLTDNLCYQYHASASAWWKLTAYARYALTGESTTNLNENGDTLVQFPTAVATDPRVTPDGSFTQFTLAPGRWNISASVRVHDAGTTVLYLGKGTTPDEGNSFASGSGSFLNVGVSDTIELTSTSTIVCYAWRGPGSATHTEAQGDGTLGGTHITFKQIL